MTWPGRSAPGCPQAVIEANDKWVLVRRESIAQFASFLKSDPELAFDYLNYVTAVDYHDYFELVYQFTSMKDNRQVVVKTRCPRNDATVPSVSRSMAGGRSSRSGRTSTSWASVRRAPEPEADLPLGRLPGLSRCARTIYRWRLRTEPFVINFGPFHPEHATACSASGSRSMAR